MAVGFDWASRWTSPASVKIPVRAVHTVCNGHSTRSGCTGRFPRARSRPSPPGAWRVILSRSLWSLNWGEPRSGRSARHRFFAQARELSVPSWQPIPHRRPGTV